MLKSDHLTVGVAGQVIVWRFKKPKPYDLLFTTQDASVFYTKRLSAVLRHTVSLPNGALDVAAQVAEHESAIDAIADLTKDGTISTSETCDMPDWANEEELTLAVTPAEQLAFYAAPEASLAILEF